MTVDTKLPPEFHPLADLSGRRSYRLVHRMPGEDPGLDRVIMESLNTAQRRAFLIEFAGELRSDGATFLDLLAEMARELGFAVIHPHRLGRVVEPLSLLEQILEEFTTWEELGGSLPEEMRGDLDLISGEYSDPTGPVSRSPAGMRWARVDYTIELLERVVKRPVAVFVDNVELGGDLETLAILERLMCERSRLSFLVVLANVGDALFPDFFEKVDSLYIRYVPEIGLDDLGLLGEELAQRLTRNRLEQYLSEIPKSRVYVEQLKAYYELELGGGFEDQLLIPKTPIQLFMYRWDRLDAERRRLLLALACQMRPQSVERLARISGFDERKVALLLDDLLERFFCERRDSSFTLGAPHFFDWIRDFADREEIGEIHRACLREGVEGTRGLARDIFRIEHLCALERFDEALAELVTVLRNLHGRGFFPTICSLGCYVEKIAPKGADRRNLLEAQLILAEADGELLRFEEALRLLDSVKDSLQEDDARWAGRELLLRGNIHEATDDSEAAVGCFQAASRRFGKTVEGARALWRAIKTQEALVDSDRYSELVDELMDYPEKNGIGQVKRIARAGYLKQKGRFPEAEKILGDLVREVEKGLPDWLLVSAKIDYGNANRHLGRFDEASGYLTEALESAHRLGDMRGLAQAKLGIANIMYLKGRFNEAAALHLECMPIYDRVRVPYERMIILNNLGMIYQNWGRLESALVCLERCRDYFSSTQYTAYLSAVELNLGLVLINLGRGEETQVLIEGLKARLTEESPYRRLILWVLGRVALEQENLELAGELFSKARRRFQDASMLTWEVNAVVYLAKTWRMSRQAQRAKVLLEKILPRFESLDSDKLKADVLQELGEVELALGNTSGALENARRALVLGELSDNPINKALIFWLMARAHLEHGDLNEAKHSQKSALDELERVLGDLTLPRYRRTFLSRPSMQKLFSTASELSVGLDRGRFEEGGG